MRILVLSKGGGVSDQIIRLVGRCPAWEVVGGMSCEKALAGYPFKVPLDMVLAIMGRLDASPVQIISAIRDKFGDSKILAVSDQLDSRLVLRIIHAGANGYMILDRTSEELTAAIETVVAGGLYLSPGIAGLEGRRPA